MKKRPQNMSDDENLTWIMNNELDYEPIDYEKDCWIAREGRCVLKDNRAQYYWKTKNRLMYQVTWENWNKKPFPKDKVARHLCGDSRCINPLHIKPGTARENELDKDNGVEIGNKALNNTKTVLPKKLYGKGNDKEKADWFLKNCTIEENNGCLLWNGQIGTDGYAYRNIDKVKKSMHRWIYSVINNTDYKGNWIARHICNNRSCVNPDHIIPGTREENAQDMRSYHKGVKLKEKQVREIIEDFLKRDFAVFGEKKSFKIKWSNEFGVSVDAIGNIVFRRRNWKDLLKEYGLL